MATYYNLASFENCQVGDIVEYTSDTAIDFTGIKSVEIVLYGLRHTYSDGGGKAQFTFNIPTTYKEYFYTTQGGTSFCLGTSYDAYNRIAVAGDAGHGRNDSNQKGGLGGGLVGGDATGNYGKGGTQTAGGTVNYSNYQNAGTFGAGGNGGSNSYGAGGNGWYGGSSGWVKGNTYGGGGGGSGFIIGQSTTVYPNEYMGNNSSLISVLESAVSNATLTQGAATFSDNRKMVVTILELAGPSVTSIAVTHMPNKTSYRVNEAFDPTGLVITAYYDDSTSAVVPSTDYTLSTPDMTTTGTKTITVSYEGVTTSFNISVVSTVEAVQYYNGTSFTPCEVYYYSIRNVDELPMDVRSVTYDNWGTHTVTSETISVNGDYTTWPAESLGYISPSVTLFPHDISYYTAGKTYFLKVDIDTPMDLLSPNNYANSFKIEFAYGSGTTTYIELELATVEEIAVLGEGTWYKFTLTENPSGTMDFVIRCNLRQTFLDNYPQSDQYINFELSNNLYEITSLTPRFNKCKPYYYDGTEFKELGVSL